MSSANVRISEEARNVLRELAQREHASMQTVLDKAIESYRRQKFLDEANTAYAALKSDPKTWEQEQEEREVWDNTLQDGLEVE